MSEDDPALLPSNHDRTRFVLWKAGRRAPNTAESQVNFVPKTTRAQGHHLIITHEVTNIGTDRSQLAHVANEAKAALDVEKLDAVADRGYFNSEEILACEEAGITVTLPKPGRRAAAKLRTRDEARRIAANVAKLPELLHKP